MTSQVAKQKANGTEGRFGHLSTQESGVVLGAEETKPAPKYRPARRGRGEQDQTNRWRCTVTGCNPVLIGEDVASQHVEETGHRIAKWPIRSKAGKAKAEARNRNGYYRKYNTRDLAYSEPKTFSPMVMDSSGRRDWYDDEDDYSLYDDVHPFSEEAFG